MKHFGREVWGYAILLIVLFCIASLATRATISYIESSDYEANIAASLIWSLTLGFMLIAGAFGLWAVKFAGESESRRRIGRLVDAMDYLSDGLLVVDRKGRVTGSNPAAAQLLKRALAERDSIQDILPALPAEDISLLLDTGEPNEVEREFVSDGDARLLRLRSQPSDDLILIVISDITRLNAQRLHSRQMARLQLIGHLARGVAYDLNNLLSGISGHASILPRLRPGSSELAKSIEAITQASEQGIAMAGHLIELAQPGSTRASTTAASEHVATAVSMLRDSLPPGWRVEESVEEQLPPVALSGIQVEQMALNLGLLAADAVGTPGVLKMAVAQPSSKAMFNVGNHFAGVILVTAATGDHAAAGGAEHKDMPEGSRESGILLSVIRSMIEEAGGTLYSFMGPDRSAIYRLTLPRSVFMTKQEAIGLPDDVKAYLSQWAVLFARPPREYGALDRRLTELGARVIGVDNVMSALARIEEDRNLDAMILDKYLLGQEAKGLLRAILKLQPLAGVVVLCDDPGLESGGLASDVVFVEGHADPNKVLASLVEAKNLALRRRPTRKLLGL